MKLSNGLKGEIMSLLRNVRDCFMDVFLPLFIVLLSIFVVIGGGVALVSCITAPSEVAVFNQLYGTHFTAKQWIFGSEMIKKEYNLDRTRINADIEIKK